MPQKTLMYDAAGKQQMDRSAEDAREFNFMLRNMSLLFMTSQVLILNDRQYIGRFWTLYESYLSMQVPTPVGLVPMDPGDVNVRFSIVNVHTHANDEGGRALIQSLQDTWLSKGMSVIEVVEKLRAPDVEVTNKRDKDVQLEKLEKFDEAVRKESSQLGLSAYVARFNMAEAIAQRSTQLAKQHMGEAQRHQEEAAAATKLGATAKASQAKTKAQQSRVAAAREMRAANQRAEARVAAAIQPISKKLDRVQKHNRQLVADNGSLSAQVAKLEGEVRQLRTKFMVP